jgi:hypothetical protein
MNRQTPSWLGEYSNDAETEYAIDRAHDEDCQSLETNHQAVDQIERIIAYLQKQDAENGSDFTYNDDALDILSELQDGMQECNCVQGGRWNSHEYRYFNGNVENYKGESPEDIRKYVRQDYERMERANAGDWCFIGIRAEAQVSFGKVHGMTLLLQDLTSGGLWGIESDSDRNYFAEVEKEELGQLEDQLHAVGFSKRAIAAAFKDVERSDD